MAGAGVAGPLDERAWTPGVGLTCRPERVEQIGGVLDVRPGPAGRSAPASSLELLG